MLNYDFKLDELVRLVTPDNPRLHRQLGVIRVLTAWGAHVETAAAAMGKFRAAWHEMEPYQHSNGDKLTGAATLAIKHLAADGVAVCQGYTGEMCGGCGSLNVRRVGTCGVCENCGQSSGCS